MTTRLPISFHPHATDEDIVEAIASYMRDARAARGGSSSRDCAIVTVASSLMQRCIGIRASCGRNSDRFGAK
jgi:hypothetical protein